MEIVADASASSGGLLAKDEPRVCFGAVFFPILRSRLSGTNRWQICNISMRFTQFHLLGRDSQSAFAKAKLEGSSLALSQGPYHRFAVFHMEKYIGDLTDKTNSALQALGSFSNIKQQLIVDERKFQECVTLWRSHKPGKIPNLELELNIYGPISIKDAVGDVLSKAKVYLQYPLSLAEGIQLVNPHWIVFPNLADMKDMITTLQPSSVVADSKASQAGGTDIHQVLEDLDRHDSLTLEATDDSLTSTLLE
jgi:hypothetical protein